MSRSICVAACIPLFLAFATHTEAQTCVQPPPGLVSWWPGEGNADDLQGTNPGVLMGGATHAEGQVGEAFLLDGADDFVDLGNDPSLHVSAGDFTVVAWVLFNDLEGTYTGGTPGDMSIVDKMSADVVNIDGWRLLKQGFEDRFIFCLGDGTWDGCAADSPAVSTTLATIATWFHVAAVKSSDGLAIYVNGQKEDFRSPLPEFLDTHSANLRIGSNVLDGAHLDGLVDEVDIYDRALSDAEIQAIFDARAAGKCRTADQPPFRRGDSDASGALNLTDAVFTLNHLFLGGTPPAEPFASCGKDGTQDELGCEGFPACP